MRIQPELLRMVKRMSCLNIAFNRNLNSFSLSNATKIFDVNLSYGSLTTLNIPTGVIGIRAFNNQINHIVVQPNSVLDNLMIHNNNFTSLFELRPVKNLNLLSLANNSINDINYSQLFGLRNLMALYIQENSMRSIDFAELLRTFPSIDTIRTSKGNLTFEETKRLQRQAEHIFGKPYYLHLIIDDTNQKSEILEPDFCRSNFK